MRFVSRTGLRCRGEQRCKGELEYAATYEIAGVSPGMQGFEFSIALCAECAIKLRNGVWPTNGWKLLGLTTYDPDKPPQYAKARSPR